MAMIKKRGQAFSCQGAGPLLRSLLPYTAHSLKAAIRYCHFEGHGLNMWAEGHSNLPSSMAWSQRPLLMSHPQSERREFKVHAQAHFLLFIQSELPAHGRVLPIVRVALPMSVNLETPSAAWLKIYFHRDSRSHQVDSQDLPHTTSSSPVLFRLSELLLYCINALDPHLPSSHLMLKHTHCIHVLL